MSYAGSTFSSTGANPPIKILEGVGIQSTAQETGTLGWLHGNSVWFYSSTHSPVECGVGGFFTDALALGMKPGDLMFGVTASGGTTAVGYATATGGTTSVNGVWLGVIVPTTAGASVVSSTGAQISSNYVLSSGF